MADDLGQTSPFQSLLERAIAQEMAQPQGRYVTTMKGNYRYGGPRTVMDPLMREHTYIEQPEPNDMAAMVAAGAQSDAAANAHRGERLHSMLGGLGHYAGAQAQMAQAQAEKAKVDWLMSPAGQKAMLLREAVGNTQNPASDQTLGPMIGGTPSPSVSLATPLGLGQNEPLPATLDEYVQKYGDAGGQPVGPDDPVRDAAQKRYGADLNKRMAGKPIGVLETVATNPLGMSGTLLRAFGLDPAKKAEATRRVFGGAPPASVGVPRPAGPPASPGVRSPAEASAGERRRRIEAIKGGTPIG